MGSKVGLYHIASKRLIRNSSHKGLQLECIYKWFNDFKATALQVFMKWDGSCEKPMVLIDS